MNTLFISMGIGVAAGLLDILPMILQKMEKISIISAFLQYFFVSIVIVHINLPGIVWWLQGSLISLALALPFLCHHFLKIHEICPHHCIHGNHPGCIDRYCRPLFDIDRLNAEYRQVKMCLW